MAPPAEVGVVVVDVFVRLYNLVFPFLFFSSIFIYVFLYDLFIILEINKLRDRVNRDLHIYGSNKIKRGQYLKFVFGFIFCSWSVNVKEY